MNRRIRIGVIDSGVHLAHPHVGNIAGGVTIANATQDRSSYVDHLGHGTAVAALIHYRAPQADLFTVKIFHHALVANVADVLAAIDWCLQNEMHLINLSLGTTNCDHRRAFEQAIARTAAAGTGIVSAFEMDAMPALPGSLPGVVAAGADASKAPGEHEVRLVQNKKVFTACPFPRDIPGVPRVKNLRGVSFAVAHVTATLANLWNPTCAVTAWEATLEAEAARLAAPSSGGHPVRLGEGPLCQHPLGNAAPN
jgi:subtilisin family serine protease